MKRSQIINEIENSKDCIQVVIEDETWKHFAYGYWVSDKGRIYSEGYGIMKPGKSKKGYYSLRLQKFPKPKTITVHKLVALCFILKPNGKTQINHIDGDKSNNCITNLEWCTAKENTDHALRTGLKVYPEHRSERVTLEEKEKMCELALTGEYSQAEIGKMFSISGGSVNYYLKRKNIDTNSYKNRKNKQKHKNLENAARLFKSQRCTLGELSKQVNICTDILSRYFKSLNDKEINEILKNNIRSHGNKKISDKQLKEAQKLYDNGVSVKELAEKYNVSTRPFYSRLKLKSRKN